MRRKLQLLAVRTPSFALLEKALSRILCGNPELYAAIQLSNPEVPATLRMLADGMSELADLVAAGDREGLIKQFFEIPRETLGRKQLQDGNADFERLANLLADLDRPHPLVITVVKNAPGTLTNVLAEFATNGINLQVSDLRAMFVAGVQLDLCVLGPHPPPPSVSLVYRLNRSMASSSWWIVASLTTLTESSHSCVYVPMCPLPRSLSSLLSPMTDNSAFTSASIDRHRTPRCRRSAESSRVRD
jgi:hypothetical protein